MTEKIEVSILRNLLCNEEYYRKVVPFLHPEYFQDFDEKVIFEEIQDFSVKYDKLPTKEVLIINLQNRNDLTEDTYKQSLQKIKEFTEELVDINWIVNTTEKWCKDKAIYNALLQAIKIADGGDKNLSRDAIPAILQEPWQYLSTNISDTTT